MNLPCGEFNSHNSQYRTLKTVCECLWTLGFFYVKHNKIFEALYKLD